MSRAVRKERKHRAGAMRFFLSLIIVAIAFCAGFFVRSQTGLMSNLGFRLDLTEMQASPTSTALANADTLSSRMEEVSGIITTSCISAYDLDKVTAAALQGIAAESNGTFEYLSPERLSTYLLDSTDVRYQGVGVLFGESNGRVFVADVIENSSASLAGVSQGDVVLAIDGDGRDSWTMVEVVNILAQKQGQNVVVSWQRPAASGSDTGEEYSTTLLVSDYTEPNVSSEIIDNVGYIQLRQITSNSAALVKTAIENLSNQGAASFVLDIRNNPGGFLSQACDIAGLFIQGGNIVQIETTEGISNRNTTGIVATTAPLVVLTNGYTAAAAEVLAGALQDNQRATIVGETTLGKGSVYMCRELSFGGGIRFLAAAYKTPLGYAIEGQGISPDVRVSGNQNDDIQKSVAIETASSLVN